MSKSPSSRVATKKARGLRRETAAKIPREKTCTTRASHPSKPKVITEKVHVSRKTASKKAIERALGTHRNIAARYEEFHDSQVPGTINAIAERSVAQTREVYERSKHTLQTVLASWEKSFGAAGQGTMGFNRKIIDLADRNINNAFDLATSLAGAKNFADVMAAHANYWRKQFSKLSAEAEDMRALSTNVAANVTEQSKPR